MEAKRTTEVGGKNRADGTNSPFDIPLLLSGGEVNESTTPRLPKAAAHKPVSARDRFRDQSRQVVPGKRGADKQFLARAVGQGDGFPAVLRRHGDADSYRSLRIAHRADHAGNDGAD